MDGARTALSTAHLVGQTKELLLFLSAQEDTRRAKVVSAPSVIATDSIPAMVNVGTEVPTLTASAPSGTQIGGNSVFANSINNRNSGVFRNLGENVSITLAGNSLIGTQYYEGANGLDMGKQTNDFRPLEEFFGSGVILDIKGVISGASALTKVGYDTVILSGTNTYTGGTNVTGGRVLIGRTNALATTGDVTTQANGVLDLQPRGRSDR